MSDSGQKFIRRNRAPRVHISYEDPYDAETADRAAVRDGRARGSFGQRMRAWRRPDIAERKFLEYRHGQFRQPHGGDRAAVSPSRSSNKLGDGNADEKLSVNLRFKKMDDFKPGRRWRARSRRWQSFSRRASSSSNLLSYMDGKAAASDQLKALLSDPQLMTALRARTANASRCRKRARAPTARVTSVLQGTSSHGESKQSGKPMRARRRDTRCR